MNRKIIILALLFNLFSYNVSAYVSLTNISENELESLVKEVGANFHQFSLVKTTNLENRYELGFISGGTNSKTLHKLAGDGSLTSIPHAALFGVMHINHGFSVEGSYLPPFDAQGVKLTSAKAGVKWAANGFFEELPVNISLMGFFGASKVDWQQNISNVVADMQYEQDFFGANLQFTKNYSIFEPYGVVGVSSNSGEINASGATNIFNTSFTTNNAAGKKVTGVNYAAGLNVSQKKLNVGIEIGRYYTVQVNSIKMSVVF